MKFSSFTFGWAALIIFTCSYGCAAKTQHLTDKYVFVNGYGETISITYSGAVVAGNYYPAKKCSTGSITCIKYGSLFAVMAPLYCDNIDDYKWSGDGVSTFLMAVTPHNPKNVLLSTTYGGWVSFGYDGEGGVTELYYDPSAQIGVKEIWYGTDYTDLKKVVYKKMGARKFMPCAKTKNGKI